jgi:hypothetical protein
MIAIVGLGVQAEAQAPSPEYLRLRNAATEAWKQAMRAPRSERCGALYHVSLAAGHSVCKGGAPPAAGKISRPDFLPGVFFSEKFFCPINGG